MSQLEVRGLTKHFGGICAVDNLDFGASSGEIVGLIGPNGAGKTTVFNLITGFQAPTGGKVIWEGKDIGGVKPYLIARMGLVRSFQAAHLFEEKTVIENVVVGFHKESRSGFWDAMFANRSTRAIERDIHSKAEGLVELAGLNGVTNELAKNLTAGYRRALALTIALAASPKILLLDEPVAGMNLAEIETINALIRKIRDSGTGVLLIEHRMRFVMELCERIVVLNFGRKIAEGSPQEIRQNPLVIKAYLGEKRAPAKH